MVSCLIHREDNQILLVKHRFRGWELPQGKVEEGENLIFALSREVLEESGVTIRFPELMTVWSKVSPPAAVIFCFVADYAGGEMTPSEETPEVEWCCKNKVLSRVSHPVSRDRIKSLLDDDDTWMFRSYATSPYRVLS